MKDSKITFIGGGNMARSLIGGLIADGFNPKNIHVADPHPDSRQSLTASYAVHSHECNITAAQGCNILVLAIKPQKLQSVAKQLAPHWSPNTLLISIAAGLQLDDIARWISPNHAAAIVRVMPNTPALVQAGASALCANAHVSPTQRDQAEALLRAVGTTVWIENESQMDAVTALSGSGPAYFFLLMEAMEQAAIEMGIAPEIARLLCLQTAFGAAKMALESSASTATLRERVTSPGGTTEQALNTFEAGGLRSLVKDALTAAADQSQILAQQLGQDNDA